MKIACLQENLAKGLGIVGRAVNPKSVLPVLGSVLLATDDGRLKLSATNLEVGINCWIRAKVEDEGAVSLPARTLIDLINTLPAERIDMELTEKTQTLNLRCAHNDANIKGIDAQDFPLVPVPEDMEGIAVEPEALRKAISQVVLAAATEETRPILTGVLIKFEDTGLTLAAADGFRLSVHTIELKQPVPEPFAIIVPARALIELKRISGDQTEPIIITVTPTRNQVLFQLTDIVLVSQLIDGNFPDYKQIIPKDRVTHTVIDTAVLLEACKAALVFARDAVNIVRIQIKPDPQPASGHMVISAISAETGDSTVEMDAYIEGEIEEIAFNVRLMIDVLSVIDTPQVALDTNSASSPGVLRPVGDVDFTHVIMPMALGK